MCALGFMGELGWVRGEWSGVGIDGQAGGVGGGPHVWRRAGSLGLVVRCSSAPRRARAAGLAWYANVCKPRSASVTRVAASGKEETWPLGAGKPGCGAGSPGEGSRSGGGAPATATTGRPPQPIGRLAHAALSRCGAKGARETVRGTAACRIFKRREFGCRPSPIELLTQHFEMRASLKRGVRGDREPWEVLAHEGGSVRSI